MQYDVKTPDDYIKLLDDDWRQGTLLALRKIICTQAPDLLEGIEYKMLSYGDNDSAIFRLNA